MNASQLPLRDIHIPEAPGWWPPAPGWWLLAVTVPLLIWLALRLYRRITRNTALKSARKLLLKIKQDTEHNDFEKLCQLSILLRRAAISLAPRSEVASLTGQAWLDYLDSSIEGKTFSEGVGRQLIEARYRVKAAQSVDLPQLITLCEHWLKAQSKRKR
ncbi:MAG: DUF4381 domain-containing protein [Gammaproteobacteria bacterium]